MSYKILLELYKDDYDPNDPFVYIVCSGYGFSRESHEFDTQEEAELFFITERKAAKCPIQCLVKRSRLTKEDWYRREMFEKEE